MADIVLSVMLLAVFAFGYFVVCAFEKFMARSFTGNREIHGPGRKVYIAETGGKDTETVSKEVGAMLDSLSAGDEYEIIACKHPDPCIIGYLEESGCTIRYGL